MQKHKDPLRDKKYLAMLAAFNGFFIFPTLIAIFSSKFHISDELCKHLLNYMGVTMLAPILGYLYSSHIHMTRKDKQDATNSDKVSS